MEPEGLGEACLARRAQGCEFQAKQASRGVRKREAADSKAKGNSTVVRGHGARAELRQGRLLRSLPVWARP